MKKTTLILACIITSFCSFAQSFTALYPFDSVKTTSGTTDPTPLPTATGVTFGSFTAVGTPANPNATGRFSFTDWSLGALTGETIYANLTGSANTSEYYEVTIAPAGVYTLSLNSISFTFTRSGTGVRTYSVRSDADGFATNLPASISPANPNLSVQAGDIFFLNTDITSNQNGSTITLSGAAFTNISVARTFRFYGFNAEGTGGTFSIDNVLIDGVATAPAVLNADFSATSVCFGNPNSFTDLSTGPNTIISWLWDFGDGSGTSVLQNPFYTYSATGTYSVSLLVTDNMANTDSYVTTVSVYENPVAMFTAPTSICAGTVAQFLDASTISSGTITNWDWNFGDP
ncbi:MAG TPA: PKD domain-containing protein, partial [Bacteroidia bacterium]|nr:PKD domain-containing protein [Bacteroidia bacterium]